jgi:acetyl esterase/lipase
MRGIARVVRMASAAVVAAALLVACGSGSGRGSGLPVTTTAVTWFDDLTGLSNKDIDVYLLAGDQDTTCPAWQSEKLASELRAAGHHVELVQLHSANHYAPVFHDLRNGDWQVITNDPAGEQTVQAILDAIAARDPAAK